MSNAFNTIVTPLRNLIVNIVYPSTCVTCGQRGVWVCDVCIAEFTPLVPGLCCDRCGHPKIGKRCECRNIHPAIVKARATSVYDGWVARAIQAYKYDRERDRAQFLAEHMAPALVDIGQVDALIPIPLHPRRQDWRGFNQAELLARHLGTTFSIPVESALIRTRETAIQARSSRKDRVANMYGAFALNPNWKLNRDHHYVLIDDVYTTGATLGACADVLEGAGAKAISVVTIAFDIHANDLERYRRLVRAASPQ